MALYISLLSVHTRHTQCNNLMHHNKGGKVKLISQPMFVLVTMNTCCKLIVTALVHSSCYQTQHTCNTSINIEWRDLACKSITAWCQSTKQAVTKCEIERSSCINGLFNGLACRNITLCCVHIEGCPWKKSSFLFSVQYWIIKLNLYVCACVA